MRKQVLRHMAVGLGTALSLVVVGVQPVKAQSFFEMLFGGGAKPAPQQPSMSGGHLTPGGRPYALPSSPVQSRRSSDWDEDDRNSGSKYRTVCVRMCDGYYFPVSTSTTKKGFYRDQMRCRASCGDEGRLFHVPASQTTIDEAVDNDGRVYAGLKTAFVYRKKRVEGCQCKPDPWSEAEVDRHRQYAEVEDAEKARQQPVQQQVAAVAKSATNKTDAPESAAVAAEVSAEDKQTAAAGAEDTSDKPARAARITVAQSDARSLRRAERQIGAKAQRAAVKPAPYYGPTPVKIPVQLAAKPPAPLAGGMGLGGGGLQWPGDAPPPQVHARRR